MTIEILDTDFAKSLGNEVFPTIANNGTDAAHDLDIGASTSVWVSNGTLRRSVSCAAMTKRIDAAWAAGDDAGGLDTGSVANTTWYYLYLIYNPTTDVSDYLISTSASSPTLPSGFTYYRRILAGACYTNGSADILAGSWNGKSFRFNTEITDVTSITQVISPTLTNVSVPDFICDWVGRITLSAIGFGTNAIVHQIRDNAPGNLIRLICIAQVNTISVVDCGSVLANNQQVFRILVISNDVGTIAVSSVFTSGFDDTYF